MFPCGNISVKKLISRLRLVLFGFGFAGVLQVAIPKKGEHSKGENEIAVDKAVDECLVHADDEQDKCEGK